jgi:hypothetical protein
MKRKLGLGLAVLVIMAGYCYIWGWLPAIPASSSSVVTAIRAVSLPVLVFLIIALPLLAGFLFSREISDGLKRRYHDLITPVLEESHRVSMALSTRYGSTEKALEGFASAMQQYAHHLASHTSAIQGLSEASQALRNSAAEQNQILSRLSDTLSGEKSGMEVSRVERVVSDLEKRTQMVLQVKDELEGRKPTAETTPRQPATIKHVVVLPPSPRREVKEPPAVSPPIVAQREVPTEFLPPLTPPPQKSALAESKIQPPPGCQAKSRALYARLHLFTRPTT